MVFGPALSTTFIVMIILTVLNYSVQQHSFVVTLFFVQEGCQPGFGKCHNA